MTTKRYAIRRTLLVRPEDYGTLAGSDYGSTDTLEDAIAIAKRHTRLGYPSRVVDTQTGQAVWVRP
jgi:hypothetical protein